MVTAAARGSGVLNFPFSRRGNSPGVFLTRGRRSGCQRWEAGQGDRSGVCRHVLEKLMVIRQLLIHDFGLDGFVYEVPCVGLTNGVFDIRRERSCLGSSGAPLDGGSMCPEPVG